MVRIKLSKIRIFLFLPFIYEIISILTLAHCYKELAGSGRHDIHHNGAQNNDTQHNNIQNNDTHNNAIQKNDIQHNVRDVQLVILQNVFGTCADKMDLDHGIDIINLMLKSH